ncbi:unnamed protein product [Paramecium octaurelia]|uniref:Uncharacterized protein n=1 Tax=Paramecium octaurelia TaxID=43137 RepID=A0A8S1WRL7_PAROT|nr:unnamed protein product [Paramecium octaurelia]
MKNHQSQDSRNLLRTIKMSFDPEKQVEKEDYVKMEKKYNELVQKVQTLFLEINNRYYVSIETLKRMLMTSMKN